MPADHFLSFFRSLDAVGFRGRTCIFVSHMGQEDQAVLREVTDDLIVIDPLYPNVAPDWAVRALRWSKHTRGMRSHYPRLCSPVSRALGADPGSDVAKDLEFRLEGVQSLRYAHYLTYLRDRPDVTHVMISDLRDVIFQRDPFETDVASLELYLEDGSATFRAAGFNRRWVEDLYGPDGVAKLGDRVVSCSGVTFGTREGMMAYLGAMSEEVNRHRPPLGAHDQAMHNWLLYNGRLGAPVVAENGYGRVLTMGAQRDIALASDGTVLNRDGSVPAVLHQYDRHVALAPKLLAKF